MLSPLENWYMFTEITYNLLASYLPWFTKYSLKWFHNHICKFFQCPRDLNAFLAALIISSILALISRNHLHSTHTNFKIIFPDKYDNIKIGVKQICFLHVICLYYTIICSKEGYVFLIFFSFGFKYNCFKTPTHRWPTICLGQTGI